jgi:hypothetical protein
MIDREVNIAFNVTADFSAVEETEQAIKDVGDSGKEAMDGIADEAARAEKAIKNVTGGETGGFGDNGRAASERRVAAAEAQRQSEAATRAKENEAKATRQLTEEEKTLAAAQKDRAEQAKRDVEDAKARKAQRNESGAEDSAGVELQDLAYVATRSLIYFKAIKETIGLANEAMQGVVGGLEKAGTDIDKLRETSPGAFLWIDGIKNLADPIAAIKDFVSTGFANLAGLDDLQRSAEQSVLLAAGIEKAKQQAKLYAEVDNTIRLGKLEAELGAVNAITAALERKIRVERSARDLQEAQAQSSDAAAIQGGADPNVVQAQATARQAQAEIAALNEDLAIAQRGVEEARVKVEQADAELSRLNSESGADSPSSQAAFTSLIKAKDALDQIKADADALETIATNKKAEIMVGVDQAFSTAGIDIQKQAADKGRALVESITGTGSELTALQQDAKARADAILADGKIAASETVAFQQAFTQLLSGVRTDTATYLELANESNAIISTMAGGIGAMKQELARLKQQVNQVIGRM